jgi:hypothetical protein
MYVTHTRSLIKVWKESNEKTCPALFFLRKQAFISGLFRDLSAGKHLDPETSSG